MDQLPIILICGGSCSGKTVFASFFRGAYTVSMDIYHVDNPVSEEKLPINFDQPNPQHIKLCADIALSLAQKKSADIPVFDTDHKQQIDTKPLTISPNTKFIVVEGLFSFYEPLLSLGKLKIFLDTPREIRVSRRMIRDYTKGRSDIETLDWSTNVEKSHDIYIEPTKKYADLVIPFSYNQIVFDYKLKSLIHL
jgi:uridine kinase